MLLKKELKPGENLIWAGQPQQGVFFRATDWVLFVAGIGNFGMAVAMPALTQNPPVQTYVSAVACGAVALYLTVGRVYADCRIRAGLCYGLTDRALLIRFPFFGKRVKRINLGTLTDFTLEEHRSSRGTICFHEKAEPPESRTGGGFGDWFGLTSTRMFERIENPRSVYAKIMEVKKGIQPHTSR
jgi:hypothetical protein